jgi:hypothetical protein
MAHCASTLLGRSLIVSFATLVGVAGGPGVAIGQQTPQPNEPPVESEPVHTAQATPTPTQKAVGGNATKPVKRTSAQSQPGQLSGWAAFGTTGFGLKGKGTPHSTVAANFSGKADRATRVTVTFQRGPSPELAPVLRDVLPETRLRGQVTHPGWRASFGEVISRSGALTGPAVRSNGGAFRWEKGRVVAETAVGQPTAFGQGRGGRLIQTNAGVKTSFGTFRLVVSDLFRSAQPNGARLNLYNTVRALSDASRVEGTGFERELQQADVQQIARLFSAANRVQGAGVQSELRLSAHHQLSVSAGNLRLTNASDQAISGASGEGRYTFRAPRASLNASVRRTPRSVPGINIPGDELAFDGSATLTSSIKVGGRFFSRSSWTLGRTRPSLTEGQSADIRYSRGRTQLNLRMNYRESEYLRKRTTRTTAIDVGTPLGFLRLDASAELGRVNDGRVLRWAEAYRGSLTWEHQSSSLSVAASYNDQGLGRMFNADIAGSVSLRGAQLRGGAEASRGSLLGSESHAWLGIELPLNRDLAVVLGVDYANWDGQTSWGDPLAGDLPASPWQGTFSIRRRLTIPLWFSRLRK